MIPSKFESLPLDIALHVLSFLQVPDLLSVRQTSKAVASITRERSVWHSALKTHVISEGLPTPGLDGRAPDALTEVELERATLRALHYWSRWTSSEPSALSCLEIAPAPLCTGTIVRNVAVRFLPGYNGRYLLTVTFTDPNATGRVFAFHCWDLSRGGKLVASMEQSRVVGIAVNTSPGYSGLLCVTSRFTDTDGPAQNTTFIYSLDPDCSNASQAFHKIIAFPSERLPLTFQETLLAMAEADHHVRLFDVSTGELRYILRVPTLHQDPTLQFEEHRCTAVFSVDDFVLTFCRQWIFLYHLPEKLASTPGTAGDTISLEPVARHRWQWRIDRIVINPRAPPPTESASRRSAPPSIDILIRFDSWYPWPVNMLHRYVLEPNPSYRSDAPPGTLPYLSSEDAGPVMVSSLSSPVRLFTPSDMVIGPRGTAVWLDAAADLTTLAQAGERGQRIAGRNPMRAGMMPAAGRNDKAVDRRIAATAYMPEGPTESGASEEDPSEMATAGGAEMSTFHVRENDERWVKVAVDDDEGRIAVACVDATVVVYSYATQ